MTAARDVWLVNSCSPQFILPTHIDDHLNHPTGMFIQCTLKKGIFEQPHLKASQ